VLISYKHFVGNELIGNERATLTIYFSLICACPESTTENKMKRFIDDSGRKGSAQ